MNLDLTIVEDPSDLVFKVGSDGTDNLTREPLPADSPVLFNLSVEQLREVGFDGGGYCELIIGLSDVPDDCNSNHFDFANNEIALKKATARWHKETKIDIMFRQMSFERLSQK